MEVVGELMGFLDEFIDTDISNSPFHKRMLMADAYKTRQNLENEEAKSKFVNDPSYVNKLVAHYSRSAMPDDISKRMPLGSPLEKAVAGIDQDDPRRGMYIQLAKDAPSIIKNSPYGTNPEESLLREVESRSAAIRPEVYKYIQKNSGWFGKKVAGEPGFEEWEKRNPTGTSLPSAALIGAGSELASMPILSKAATMAKTGRAGAGAMRLLGGALSMAPPIGPVGVGTKLLGAALVGMTAFSLIDLAEEQAAKSGHPMGLPEQLAVGALAFGGTNALAKSGAKAFTSAMEKEFGKTGLTGMEKMFSVTGRGEGIYGGVRTPQQFVRDAKGVLQPVEEATPAMLRDSENMKWAKLESAGRLEKQKIGEQEKLAQLTDEDIELITTGTKTREEVTNARVAANLEIAARDSQLQQQLEGSEVLRKAKLLQTEDMSLEEAVKRAEGIVRPTEAQTIHNTAFLRQHGIDDNILRTMSPRERAERVASIWKYTTTKEQPYNLTEFMFPPAIIPQKQNPFRVMSTIPGVIRAGMPVRPLLPESKAVPLLPPPETVLSANPEKAIVPEFTVHSKSGPAINLGMPTLQEAKQDMFSRFNKTAQELAVKHKDNPTALADELRLLDQSIERYGNQLASTYRLSSQKVDLLRKELFDFKSGLKKLIPNEETAEAAAKESIDKIVNPLATSTSPKGGVLISKSSVVNAEAANIVGRMRQILGGRKTPTKAELAANPELKTLSTRLVQLRKAGSIFGAAGLLIPLSAIIPSQEAQASPLTDTAAMAPKMLQDVISASGKPAEEMARTIIDAGYGAPKIATDGRSLISLMKSMSFIPPSIRDIPQTVVSLVDRFASIGTRDDIHFNIRTPEGLKAPYGIGTEVNYRSQVALANTDASLKIVRNIMKEAGAESNLKEISDFMQPLVDKYHGTVDLEMPYWQGRLDTMRKALEGKYTSEAETELKAFSKAMKYVNKDYTKLDPQDRAMYDTIAKAKEEAKAKIAELEGTMKNFHQEYDEYAKQAAEKWSTARIALAVDGYGMKEGDAWLASMLSPQERQAVAELKELNRVYAVRMEETGHKVLEGDYIHHAAHPSVDYSADLAHLSKIASGGDGAEAMRLVNFFHRSSGSRLVIPDTEYVMAKYIPDAAKRIEISDMWKMGKPGGWDFIRKQMQASGGYEGALKLIDDVRVAFDPVDVTPASKWLNRYTAFEVARLLTLSPSVSFKHALKLMGNWSIFPVETSIKSTGENITLWNKWLAHDLVGDAFKGKDEVADLARALTHLHHTYASVSDMAPYEVPVSLFDTFLQKWNTVGSSFVNGVERFDRGQTFIASMMMAQKKGMTPEQAMYGLMDSVLKVNFLTGPNNPKWLKDPFIRMMMMFQGTPFRILEQRTMLAYQAGKDVSSSLKLLKQLRDDIKTGEANFKWHMLKDELTKSKDVFGNSYTTQFLKQMMVLGTVIYGGKTAFDSDMWGHAIHIPGMQLGERGMQLGVNPLVSATYQTMTGGNKTPENEDDFWLSRFFQTWFGKSKLPVPAIAHKIARLSAEDIPVRYKDNKLSYLFGVPRIPEE